MTRHHERKHPAPASRFPAGGLVLATLTRENGDAVRVLCFALPCPHVRIEVTRGNDTHHVAIALAEVATIGTALLHAARRLAGRSVA
jgi:hypothetical protein